MYDLNESIKNLKFDKRMTDWNVKRNSLTLEEHSKYLKQLKDISHLKSAEEVETEEESSSPE